MTDTAHRFPASCYAHRLAALQQSLSKAANILEALVITPGPDFQYLTGSGAVTFERLTALIITPDSISVVAPRIERAALADGVFTELAIEILEWVDGDDVYELVAQKMKNVSNYGVSEAMPALHLLPLFEKLSGTPELATSVISQLRMVKDAAEINALRRAGTAIDRVHAHVPALLKPGRTEREIAQEITALIVQEGHTEAAFVIVGSGPNGADPHHEFNDRVLCAGDIVVVDIGGPVAPGYNSDSTRTYALGKPEQHISGAIEILRLAQESAVVAVRPGVTAHEIDSAARDYLEKHNLAEYFLHRTGHGIGLSVHEQPYIMSGNDLVLSEGMTFSVEPGIYFPDQWGARIEDIVLVTSDGCERLNNAPHQLVIVE